MRYTAFCRLNNLPLSSPASRQAYDAWQSLPCIPKPPAAGELAHDAPPVAWRRRLRALTTEIEQARAALEAAQELAIRGADDLSLSEPARARLGDLLDLHREHASEDPAAATEYEARLEAARLRRIDIPAAERHWHEAKRQLVRAEDSDLRAQRQRQRIDLSMRYEAACAGIDKAVNAQRAATTPERKAEFRRREDAARARAEDLRQRYEAVAVVNVDLLQAEADSARASLHQLVTWLGEVEAGLTPGQHRMPLVEARTLRNDPPPDILCELLYRYSLQDGALMRDGKAVKAATIQVEGYRLPTATAIKLLEGSFV